MKTSPTLNPVTRILGLLIVTTPLLLSVDIVSAGVSLAWTVLLAPLLGVDFCGKRLGG